MSKSVSKTKRDKLIRENKSILSFFKSTNESDNSIIEKGAQKTPSEVNRIVVPLTDTRVSLSQPRQNVNNFWKNIGTNKECPKYKWLMNTPFTVDAFRYGLIKGCSGYFLTHFHHDHYIGLTSKFVGTIYCSEITAKLLEKNFGQLLSIVALPTDIFINVSGFDILLLDANHCPGSVLILCRLPTGNVNLHTGDFRAQASMLKPPSPLTEFIFSKQRISNLYLDTSFCAPKYTFPLQESVIDAAIQISREALITHPGALILCGMYTIGKERFVLGLAEQLNSRVWLPSKQRGFITAAAEGGCSICKRLIAISTITAADAKVHVVDMSQLNPRAVLSKLLPLNRPIIAWKPSGWMYNPQKKLTQGNARRLPCSSETLTRLKECVSLEMIAGSVYVFGAAYSEHSSFDELKEFVTALRPLRVQQTVFGGEAKDAAKYINEWLRSG